VTCVEARRLIDAYLDDELPSAEASSVRTHVEGCRTCERAAEARLVLRSAVQQGPYYSAPDRLRTAVLASTRRPPVRLPRFLVAAAAVMTVLAVGATAARIVQIRRDTDAIAESVVQDHVRALRSQTIVDVRSSDQHTVKPWFLGKLDYAPPVQDLAAMGFPLAGGRLAKIDGRTVAVLVYQRRLHPITVFVWPEGDAPSAAAGTRSVRGFNVRHWTSGGMAFWAVTDANPADLEELAKALRP
jgi:anti-sigma factor RsiW